jgi:hypothetical protein
MNSSPASPNEIGGSHASYAKLVAHRWLAVAFPAIHYLVATITQFKGEPHLVRSAKFTSLSVGDLGRPEI